MAARAVGGDGRAPQSAKSHAGVFFLIAFSFAAAIAKEKAGGGFNLFFWLLTMLKFYLVGVGVTLSRRRRHTRFAYVSIPVDDPLLSRGEHRSPARYLKKLLFYRAFE